MNQLERIRDPNELIPGQSYIIKAGFSRKKLLYKGLEDIPKNFDFAINADILCEWEENKLMNIIMEVIAEFHLSEIDYNDEYKNLSEVIKDGSIFMNKMKLINDNTCLAAGANKPLIIRDIKRYYQMAQHLQNSSIKYVSFDWCFYRSSGKELSKSLEINKKIVMPLPFSVTSSFTVAKNWMNDSCCLFKILVPGGTPFACLERFYNVDKWNTYDKQLYEGETCLPAGVLKMKKKEIICLKDLCNVHFYTCVFEPYNMDETIEGIIGLEKCL